MTWAPDVFDPIRDALKVLCGGKEPPIYVKGHDLENLTDGERDHLQNWVNMHLAGDIFWSTGIGAIEAAELLVTEALGNDNILGKEVAAIRKDERLLQKKKQAMKKR